MANNARINEELMDGAKSDDDICTREKLSSKSEKRVLITSKKNINGKQVTFETPSSEHNENHDLFESSINNLESCMTTEVSQLRKIHGEFQNEKKELYHHIKSLERSLIEVNESCKEFRTMTVEKDHEVRQLTEKIGEYKRKVSNLEQNNENLQSDHSDHLQSIAQKQRRKRIAKRSITTWREKLKAKDSSKVLKLKAENAFLKQEMVVYQESAKQAFLRSANALNSEALTIFQKANTRILNSDICAKSISDEERSIVFTPDSSNHSEAAKRSRNKENKKRDFDISTSSSSSIHHDDSFNKPDCSNCGAHRSRSFDDYHAARRKTSVRDKEMEEEEPKISYVVNKSASTYLPQPLRNETRQILQDLQKTGRSTKRPTACSEKNNVDDGAVEKPKCRCSTNPSHYGPCPSCFLKTPNLAKMPYPRKSFTQKTLQSKNIIIKTNTRPKVIYKPSGSTVVVEKHLV